MSKHPGGRRHTLMVLLVLVLAHHSISGKERPELTSGMGGKHMGLRSGIYEPTLKWTHGGRVLGCDYAAGVDIRATHDEKDCYSTYNVFGCIKRSLWGWNFKARLDTASGHLQTLETYFHMEGGPTNTWLTIRGNVARNLSTGRLTDLGVSQPLQWRRRAADVSTNYDLENRNAEYVVAYIVREASVITLGAYYGKENWSIIHLSAYREAP